MCTELVTINCGECGITFCMPESRQKELRKTHETFYCPNGHPRHYPGKTEQEKRIEELEHQLALAEKGEHQGYHLAERVRDALTLQGKALAACPFGCGFHTSRRMATTWDPSDEDVARYVERVTGDLRQHLQEAHVAREEPQRLLGAGAAEAVSGEVVS